MAIEVFNTTGYIFEASATNPEFAAFFRNTSPYILESPAVNSAQAVFTLGFSAYVFSGRATPNNVDVLGTRLYSLVGMNPTKVGYRQPALYEITGGQGGNEKVALPKTKFYMITN